MNDDEEKENQEIKSFNNFEEKEKQNPFETTISQKNIKKLISKSKKTGFFLGVCLTNIFLIIGIIYLALKPKTEIGYVVEVSQLTGEQRKIENVVKEVYEYSMPEYILANVVRTYIVNLRGVSNDDEVNRENERNVYAHSQKNAVSFIRNYYEKNNPVVRGKTERVKIDVINCQRINTNDKDTFKFLVDWNEVVSDLNFQNVKSDKDYRADIDVKQYKPNDLTAKRNPVGVYITNITISEIENGYIKTRE